MQVDRLFWINNGNFSLEDYSINLKKESGKIIIESEYEINGSFNLPPKTIYINYLFPNQISEFNYLSKIKDKKCKSKKETCFVYKSNSFILLENDKTFNKEIINPKNIKLNLHFGIDTRNLSSINSFGNQKPQDAKNYYSFIENINNKNFQNYFNYKNTYEVFSNEKDGINNISVVKLITIEKNKPTKYKEEIISFKLLNHKNTYNTYIKDWYQCLSDSTYIEQLLNSIEIGNSNETHSIQLKNELNEKDGIFSYGSSIAWNEYKKQWVETWNDNRGFFIPHKIAGELKSKIKLTKNHSENYFVIKNKFQFKNDHSMIHKNMISFIKKEKINFQNIDLTNYESVDL